MIAPAHLDVIERHWGFRTLRPLQAEAIRADLEGRDSLVVLPTGGGKSLCYQAPAAIRGAGHTTVVLSPLIALMKDQVDGLRACGIAAAQLDSSLSASERWAYEMDLRQGQLRALFISPERLVQTDLYRVLQKIGVHTFAIDEAHCISHWGHDFRPEYRQLSRLHELFPGASVHAYTATATEQVRRDIIQQLGLHNPEVLVGNFDRPNLTYRALPRRDPARQIGEVLGRHAGEAGIIYCPTRKDVDELAESLCRRGVNARPYHAGLSPEERRQTQEAFTSEQCDVVVATVAFGMGIDRSNVRFVLHTALPRSLEHYQQETGRAGRDGLEAECVLLYSGADVVIWRSRLQNPRDREGPPDPEYLASALRHLDDMYRYCRTPVCRHRALVGYFGQAHDTGSCDACDLCLGDTEEVPEATLVAQKVLSCVARVKESFGIGHVVAVLRGQNSVKIRERKHDQLTTFGLLRDHAEAEIRDWVYQLIGQEVLLQAGEEYPVLHLNAASWEVMRGQRTVRLIQSARRKKGERPQRSHVDAESWEGVDRELFDALRELRRELAAERQVPPYVVFADNTLRDLARVRPSTPERMRTLYGVGENKLRDFGARFLAAIRGHCEQHGLAQDQGLAAPPRPAVPARVPAAAEQAWDLFRRGASVEAVMTEMNRARGTVLEYLASFIRHDRPASITAWIEDATYQRVAAAAREVGSDRLKPIFLALGEQVSYDAIRLVLAHLQSRPGVAAE